MSPTTFAGLTISPDLAGRLALLSPSDRERLRRRIHERQGRGYIGGRELGDLMESALFAQDAPGYRYFRALMRLDRRAR